jgi:hypothetical protein
MKMRCDRNKRNTLKYLDINGNKIEMNGNTLFISTYSHFISILFTCISTLYLFCFYHIFTLFPPISLN